MAGHTGARAPEGFYKLNSPNLSQTHVKASWPPHQINLTDSELVTSGRHFAPCRPTCCTISLSSLGGHVLEHLHENLSLNEYTSVCFQLVPSSCHEVQLIYHSTYATVLIQEV